MKNVKRWILRALTSPYLVVAALLFVGLHFLHWIEGETLFQGVWGKFKTFFHEHGKRHVVMALALGEPPRSGEWPKVEHEHLESNPKCAACGSNQFLNVHHIIAFKHNPALELDPKNLITLCRGDGDKNCHLLLGHGGNFKFFVSHVAELAAECLAHKMDRQTVETRALRERVAS